MLSYIFLGFGFVAAALADDSIISSVPTCAQQPLINAIANSTCSATDFTCICSNVVDSPDLAVAVEKACSPADIATLLSYSSDSCGGSNSTSSSTSASATSSGTASSTGKTTSTTSGASSTATGSSSSGAAPEFGAQRLWSVGFGITVMAALFVFEL